MNDTPISDIIEALRFLCSLPGERRNALIRAIEQQTPSFALESFARHVAQSAGLSDQSLSVQNLILAFAGFVPQFSPQADDLSLTLTEGFRTITGSDAEPPQIPDDFREALRRILQSEPTLGVTSKAHEIMWGVNNSFFEARTFSSIRPIFQSDLGEPRFGVLLHELRLRYRTSGARFTSDFVVAMDDQQVTALIEVLERCLEKDEKLRESSKYELLRREEQK
jgi:hypothetical protein